MKRNRVRHRKGPRENLMMETRRHAERMHRGEEKPARQTTREPLRGQGTPVLQEKQSLTRDLRKEAEQIMLQMEKIGAYIARLRKANGMTQGKLAQRLNVSHQAVSNWERGDSLPDASQWIPLSRVLGTSVDLLLYGGELPEDTEEEFLEEAAEATGPDIVFETDDDEDEDQEEDDEDEDDEDEEDDEDDEEDEDDEDDDEEDGDEEDGGAAHVDDYWRQAVRLAPFLSRQGMEKIVRKACESGRPDWSKILRLAPFLDRSTLDYLVDEACKGDQPEWDVLQRLAPFLSRAALDMLVERAYQEEQPNWRAIRRLAPFLSRTALDRIVEKASEGERPDMRAILGLAPFLGREALTRLLRIACQGEQPDWSTIQRLAPFLPSEMVDELVCRAMDGKPLHRSEAGEAEKPRKDGGTQSASDKRGRADRRWSSIRPEEIVETVQEEVLNALDIGKENLNQIKDAVWKSIDRFFTEDRDR